MKEEFEHLPDTRKETARDEGRLEGRAEGESKKALDVAKKAIGMGMTDEQISLLTGLSVSEIHKLRME